ncbi:glucosidase [Pontibacter sp. E15-1]|uniref:MGH1-like glycoside hydrolase domain-containing protein n=1 Tax=Pontibacter sp. E15-1 TaxID=2919918 RepID=UPI001F502F56|nr:glucosidase [Pontibacter sp. E15-1]MCJ8163225.1 glucosidase [Pontibacter sp. E15-1]
MNAEEQRLAENYTTGKGGWLKWGPYLSERQWGTVREDYSAEGNAWTYFPHDHARSRAYRWGEDGIAGISDHRQHICFAIALWNHQDPILKERLYGLTGKEGNHGEDVKELYYYLDNTPTHTYMKHLYKYPQQAFPYAKLLEQNSARGYHDPEYELLDTGIFDEGRYFDVFTEYAKASEEDICIRITLCNRGQDPAPITLLPTLWCSNRWSFGLASEKPVIRLGNQDAAYGCATLLYPKVGAYSLYFDTPTQCLFTENDTNKERLFDYPNATPFVKDAFHDVVVGDSPELLHGNTAGTKFAPVYRFDVAGGEQKVVQLRLRRQDTDGEPFGPGFNALFRQRIQEADQFYGDIAKTNDPEELLIQRQALAGMLWSKQYYNYDVPRWLSGDPGQPPPPDSRYNGRNTHWNTLNNEDIISMPDKWEYPWYAAWDLGFHCVALAMVDLDFAKSQLILFLREWYMHPNGQLPAYEWSFDDVNPPVHAWSCLEVYRIDQQKTGRADYHFLEKAFHKLLINFTWWVNRKDSQGNNIFEGGFLGLDNIGVFDRSEHIPGGGTLEQADGTAWMAMYSLNMLEIALELSQYNKSYEDVATKFFEHFIYITESLNQIHEHWAGSWDEEDSFFYDVLALPNGTNIPIKIRSLVGLTTLFAVLILKKEQFEQLPDFYGRLKWFQKYRRKNKAYRVIENDQENEDILLSLVPRDRLKKLMQALLSETEFLAPGGIRSLSKIHTTPYILTVDGESFSLDYQPGEANSPLFGGNSNWRGPVWFPVNYLLIQSLEKHCAYFEGTCKVEYPTGSGTLLSLSEVADELSKRLISVFKADNQGNRRVNGAHAIYREDPHFKDLILFYEYFHGDTCQGLGASHQTGWTGLVAELINRTKT